MVQLLLSLILLYVHIRTYCTNVMCNCYTSQTLIVVMSIGFTFGVISAFSPEYYSLLLFRGLLGFGFGGGFLG